MKNLDKFLEELTIITKKYELEIGGCGCCSSPFITEIKNNSRNIGLNGHYICGEDGDDLSWEENE